MLAEAMLALMADRTAAVAMGAKARQRYVERFLPGQMSRRYEELYRKALGNS